MNKSNYQENPKITFLVLSLKVKIYLKVNFFLYIKYNKAKAILKKAKQK